jgi:hypothetical protein
MLQESSQFSWHNSITLKLTSPFILKRKEIALNANVDDLLKGAVEVAMVGLGDGMDAQRLALGMAWTHRAWPWGQATHAAPLLARSLPGENLVSIQQNKE